MARKSKSGSGDVPSKNFSPPEVGPGPTGIGTRRKVYTPLRAVQNQHKHTIEPENV